MAISTVAVTKLQTNSALSVSGAVSATAGNALIVAAAFYNAGAGTLGVTRTGDTYTQDVSGGGGASFGNVGICSAPNVAGGSVSMTVSTSGAGGGGLTAWAVETSGLATSSMRDATSPAVATANSGTATTNALSNTTADAIYFAISDSDVAGTLTLTSTGSGWSDVVNAVKMQETNNSSEQAGDTAWIIVSSTASRTESWTVSATGQWYAAIAVYKAGAFTPLPPGLGPSMQMEPPSTIPIGW